MTGWIPIDRDIFASEFFAKEPMSEREAWIWMQAKAAWEDTRHRVGGDMHEVLRGSFMATLREMQSAFMWRSDARVRGFLKRLENERMIERTTVGTKNAPKTHVTICNYEEKQVGKRTENAPRTHHARTENAVKEQYNNKQGLEPKGSLSSGDDVNAEPFDEISEAVSQWNDTAEAQGWPKIKVLSKARRSALSARLKECGGLDGWSAALAKARAAPHLNGRNDRGWTASFDFITRQSSFAKLMEGNYDDRTTSGNSPANRGPFGFSQSSGRGRGAGIAGIAAQRAAERRRQCGQG